MRCARLLPILPLILGLTPALHGEEDARKLITKAIQAHGGDKLPSPSIAVRERVKGTMPSVGGVNYTAEFISQGPQHFRAAFDMEVNGNSMPSLFIFNSGKGWQRFNNGPVEPFDDEMLTDIDEDIYVDKVSGLIDLLKDKSFTLTALGPGKVEERPVVGVKVASAGHPDVELFFEKDTMLLAKVEYTGLKTKKKSHVVVLLSNYREPDHAGPLEKVLRDAHQATDGPALVAFFRKQSLGADAARIKQLISQLGASSYPDRKKASQELIALGAAARPYLQDATSNADVEVARAAKHCLQIINNASGTNVVTAAIRLLAQRKPEGATEALLEYLPSIKDPKLMLDARATLAALATLDGKPNPILVKALTDKDAVRQAAAAAVLGRDKGVYAKQPGRRLYPTGFKVAGKLTAIRDGQKLFQRELQEIAYFNRLDDSMFSKPAAP